MNDGQSDHLQSEDGLHTIFVERRAADKEFVGKDAESPEVNRFTVCIPANHLRWEVVQRATHSLTAMNRQHMPHLE